MVNTIHLKAQVLSCEIQLVQGGLSCFHSFVYGLNKGVERKVLWQDLCAVKRIVGASPWLISGDFNVVKSVQEKWSRSKLNC